MISPLELPELPPCPTHPEGPRGCIADCSICWSKFYFRMEYEPILKRLNRCVTEYELNIERSVVPQTPRKLVK